MCQASREAHLHTRGSCFVDRERRERDCARRQVRVSRGEETDVGSSSTRGTLRPRQVTALYQTAARIWLTAAAAALLLPVAWRLGLWVPLHLALAGAISVAICGAMQNFALTLTATPPPPAKVVWAQFISVNAGVAAISIGMPTSTPGLTAAGGTAFVISMALLGWTLWRAWRRSLILRHPVPVAMYAAAVLSVLLGGALGALMGARVVGGTTYLAVRHAHLTANVLGWASFAVVGTLFTLLPTVLRVRMPPKGGRFVAV